MELYLIAHKVRGEPAFDIACKLQIGDEEGWIIPTSGHRAYPYWSLEINFYNDSDSKSGWGASFYLNQGPNLSAAHFNLPDMPDDLPDHYQHSAREEARMGSDGSLLQRLGLLRAREPLKRRV